MGLLTESKQTVLVEGSQIVSLADAVSLDSPPVHMIGHVSSSYMSPTLQRSIAMALIEDGRKRLGEKVAVIVHRRAVYAHIVAPRFYDLEGARLNA